MSEGDTAAQAAATAAATAAAATAAAAAAAAAKPWYDGKADAELIGHMQNKGWDKDPIVAGIEATKAHLAAQKLIGVPADQMIRLPVDPSKDPAAMATIWQRLGAPAKPEEYDLPALKGADGKVTNEVLDTTLRASMFKAGVPKSAAADVAAAIVKMNDDLAKAAAANTAATIKDQRELLDKNWGAHKETNLVIAKNAAAALGFTPQQIDDLEKVASYAGIMEKLRTIGTKIGEAKFLQPEGPGGATIVSVDQAKARLAELKADTVWTKKLLESDAATLREFRDLNKLIASEGPTYR